MQWDRTAHAGFTTGTPWLPLASDAPAVNVAHERVDSASMLTLYHDLLALRRTEPALARGAYRMLPRQGSVLAYVRDDETHAARDRLLILVNFAAGPAAYVLDANATQRLMAGAAPRQATFLMGTHTRPDSVALPRIALQPNEAVIVKIGASLPPRSAQ